MNVALGTALTVEAYLARAGSLAGEQRRTELINGQIVEMSPEKVEHNEVKANVYLALRAAIRSAGLPFHAVADGMTVRIDDYTAYEPDAAVYEGDRLPRGAMIIPEPVIVVEVVSPSSEHSARSAKLIGYFKLASVLHYLIIDPLAQTVEHHTRVGDAISRAKPVRDRIALDPTGIEFDVASLFE